MKTTYFACNLNAHPFYTDIGMQLFGEKTDFPFRLIVSLHAAGHMTLKYENVLPDRWNFFHSLSIDPVRVVALNQVHSKIVIPADSITDIEGKIVDADGLVTGNDNDILSVTVADCLPVFLWSDDYSVFSLLHSGWRGTGIVLNALELLKRTYRIDPERIHAVIGPGIGACCYAVPEERYDVFRKEYSDAAVSRHDNQYYLNLREANRIILEDAGIASCAIATNCTCCSPQLGSYRRDGKEGFHNMMALFGRF